VARDMVDRGFRAVESIGERDWSEGWVLPAPLLAANGFAVVHDDARYPLMRLELRTALEPQEAVEAAAVPLPAPGLA
jgi:hypothetical protein